MFLDEAAVRAEVNSPTYLGALWSKRDTALVHPGKLARELATGLREGRSRDLRALPGHGTRPLDRPPRWARSPRRARRQRRAWPLATNVFPSLLKRNRLHDRAGVRLRAHDRAADATSSSRSIGWTNRQGLTDIANQFHYYRLSADNRILCGGYDAIYHYGGRIRPEYEDRRESFEKLASHFFTTFPQLEGVRFSNRWAGVIDTCTRFCAFFGSAHGGRVAYAAGFTGLGVAATRFAADVMLDLLGRPHDRTHVARHGARASRCRSRPSPPPTSACRRPAGRSTAPTTTAASATCCCRRSTQSG